MQKPLIPISHIRDLKCRHCQKFISCGPVYVVPDSSILCGRCRMLAKDIYRNISYEALASIFRYTCINWENHCPVTLLWNESLEHEDQCNYSGCWRFFWSHPGAYFKGKRDIFEGDITRLTSVPDYLLDHIKCVLCECYLSCEPVYIQTNGKNICHRCVSSNGTPPNCLRNISYEKLAHILIFPCIYRNRGCPTRLRFGRELWQHESVCSYGQIFKKITKNPSQKERGVIKTHSGHTYGTITPNSQLFAPPKNAANDVNKELIKSLVKKQERKIRRADDIAEFSRMDSEDGSVSTIDSCRKISNDKSSSASGSAPPTPIGELNARYPNTENHIAQIHKQNEYSNQSSRNVSRSNSTKINNYYPNVDHYRQHSDEIGAPVSSKSSFSKPYLPYNIDNEILAGHFPVFGYFPNVQQSEGYENESRLSRTESIGQRDLINELKIRQSLIQKTNSIRGVGDRNSDSPYKQCNNLEEILQVHDQLK